MKLLDYNYALFGSFGDLLNYSYSDLDNIESVYRVPHEKRILGVFYGIYRLHFSREVNKRICLPFKGCWNGIYFKDTFREDKPICFVFMGAWARMSPSLGLITYYRRKYPNCKIVWFAQDLMSKVVDIYKGTPIDVKELISNYDMVISFDTNDCQKYGLVYHPLVFSKFEDDVEDMPLSDVYFLAKAKDRLPEIIQTYEVLRSKGLKLDFYLTGVSPENQVYKDEIKYGQGMTYSQNLQHVIHTKCLLEIMQHGGGGYTQRGAEAVCFNKKLLTNNTMIHKEPFYDSRFISQFENVGVIDNDFLNKINSDEAVDYKYREQMSPIKLIEFIDNNLSNI